jgi:hypothetical protein
MSYLVVVPEFVASAATDLSRVGSALSAARAAAAAPTTGVLAAGADEVSAAVASLFSGFGHTTGGAGGQGLATGGNAGSGGKALIGFGGNAGNPGIDAGAMAPGMPGIAGNGLLNFLAAPWVPVLT